MACPSTGRSDPDWKAQTHPPIATEPNTPAPPLTHTFVRAASASTLFFSASASAAADLLIMLDWGRRALAWAG